jgi:hypothetical protein
MKTATVREFRDRATTWLKEEEPILVTRRGRVVGFVLPATGAALPLEIRKELFYALTNHFRSLIKTRRLTEETLLGDRDLLDATKITVIREKDVGTRVASGSELGRIEWQRMRGRAPVQLLLTSDGSRS